MKKSTKIFIVFALIGIFLGICGTVMMTLGYNENNNLALESKRMGMSQLPVWTHEDRNENVLFMDKAISSTTLKVSISEGDIRLMPGDEFRVEGYGFSKNAYDVFEENGTVNVVYQDNYIFFPFRTKNNKRITIYVPSTIIDIDVSSSLGDVDVSNITAENIKIKSSVGDIDIKNVIGKYIDIKSNTGDVEFNGDFNSSMTVSGDIGDIDILLKGAFEDYDYDIQSSIGEIINQGNKTDGIGGNYRRNNDKNRILQINSSVGDISIKSN